MMVQPHPDAARQQHRYFRTVATRRLPVDRGNMAVAALLKEKPKPTNADVDAAITNICRCGTFQQRELIWSREEDMLHGQFHPLTQAKLAGGFDAQGNWGALHMRVSGQSILSSQRPGALQKGKDPLVFQGLDASGQFSIGYTIPNLLIDQAMRNPHVPPGFWRGVNVKAVPGHSARFTYAREVQTVG